MTEVVMMCCICGYELHKNGVHKTYDAMLNGVVDGVASARLVITQHALDRPAESSAHAGHIASGLSRCSALNLHSQAQTRL